MARPGDERFDKDMRLADACLALAKFGTSRHDARREIEWKLSFGIWALLAAALLRGFVALPALAALIPIGHAFWLRNLWLRHAADNELVWNFVNEAQRLLGTYDVAIMPPKTRSPGRSGQAVGWTLGLVRIPGRLVAGVSTSRHGHAGGYAVRDRGQDLLVGVGAKGWMTNRNGLALMLHAGIPEKYYSIQVRFCVPGIPVIRA
jgi:hypothetical protein